MKSSLQFLSIRDNSLFDTYRTETVGGREYIVVNGIPLVEGVLNKRLVTADEFGTFVNDWNDIPVVLRHPKQNGGSARVVTPDVIRVGRFYNARMDGKRLGGEYWLDKALLEDLRDNQKNQDAEIILSRVESNQPIENSTGYWSESIPESGKFNGKDYESVDRNIHPDHIAIFGDNEIGACSIKDGCGMNRNQAMCQNCEKSGAIKTNAALGSYEGKMQAVYEAFNKQFRDASGAGEISNQEFWVSETYPDHIISRVDGEWYWIGYSIESGEYKFDDRSEWKKAIRVEEYLIANQQGITHNVTSSLPPAGKKMWEEVYQSALKQYDDDKEKAAAVAWSAVKKKYRQKDGVWHEIKTNQSQEPDLEALAITLLLAESI